VCACNCLLPSFATPVYPFLLTGPLPTLPCPPPPLRYIADVVAELRNPKSAHDGWQARLVFKKRMFRETDEAVSEPQFINLSYIQVSAAGGAAWVGCCVSCLAWQEIESVGGASCAGPAGSAC
jgi:hypothetical protein